MKAWYYVLFLWLGTTCVFGILFYFNRFFYKRQLRIKELSTAKTEGRVVAYARTNEANPPIVEYVVDGKSYRRALEYTVVTVISSPFKPRRAQTPSNLFDNKITIVRNSVISFTSILQDAFPKGSLMTVWYNPDNPKESFVERYCGKDKSYQIEFKLEIGLYLFLTIILLTTAIFFWRGNIYFTN